MRMTEGNMSKAKHLKEEFNCVFEDVCVLEYTTFMMTYRAGIACEQAIEQETRALTHNIHNSNSIEKTRLNSSPSQLLAASASRIIYNHSSSHSVSTHSRHTRHASPGESTQKPTK